MPKQSIAKVPPRANLCVFCALRYVFNIGPSTSVHLQPTRQFTSSSSLSRPPGTATVVREDEKHSATPYPAQPTHSSPSFGGGWGKPARTASSLTTEESRQRAALQQKFQPEEQAGRPRTQSQNSPWADRRESGSVVRGRGADPPPLPVPRSSTSYSFGQDRSEFLEQFRTPQTRLRETPWNREAEGRPLIRAYDNSPNPSTSPRTTTARQIEFRPVSPTIAAAGPDWTCQCGHINLPNRANCLQCDFSKEASVAAEQKQKDRLKSPAVSAQVTHGWKHVKLRAPNAFEADSDTGAAMKAENKREGDWQTIKSTPLLSKDNPTDNVRDPSVAKAVTPEETVGLLRKGGRQLSGRNRRGGSELEYGDFEDEMDFGGKGKGRKKRKALLDEESEGLDAQGQRRRGQEAQPSPPTPIYLPDFITVGDLARVLRLNPDDFIKQISLLGFEGASYDHVLDAETAGLISAEYNFEHIPTEQGAGDLVAQQLPEDQSAFPTRPPVVTIMGHVDHGKTTILDWLRKSSVAASEHGGITQHIGAFSVQMPGGKLITFLDTPGHAAFLDMRRRGANVTDIVILVVAADDSVKPQTVEAIKHAQSANVPIIVAINKVDKPDANIEKVKHDLARAGVSVEDFGGDIQAIPISGKTGQGMGNLEEAMGALSEQLDHRADTGGSAEGWVIEAATTSAGRVATVLVRTGTMTPGDVIVAGTTWGRIRSLKNDAGVQIQAAPPGTPVQIDGWREQPLAGDEVLQAVDERQAKEVVALRLERAEVAKLSEDTGVMNAARQSEAEKRAQEEGPDDPWWRRKRENAGFVEDELTGVREASFVVKADVSGSVEAVVNSIAAIGNNEIHASVIHSGVGPITKSDVLHAATANGQIISFNQPVDGGLRDLAERSGTSILDHNIIYKVIDDVKERLSDMLPKRITQRVHGEAEIGQVFDITSKSKETISIAGCKITNGVIDRKNKVRVLRSGEIVYDGTLSSLKNIKKDVTEMRKGHECGLGFANWSDFNVGDQLQCYEETSEKRTL